MEGGRFATPVTRVTPDWPMLLYPPVEHEPGRKGMKRMATATAVMLFSWVGVAYADSPGGWSQFNDMTTKAQASEHAASVQQVQQAKPVYEFNTTQQRNTAVFPADSNQRTSN
jgi:hypothetical protein